MSGTGGPPRQSPGTDNPLVGRIDGWSHKRREAPDRTPPIDRLTIAPKGQKISQAQMVAEVSRQ
jgi:hypothetical protein